METSGYGCGGRIKRLLGHVAIMHECVMMRWDTLSPPPFPRELTPLSCVEHAQMSKLAKKCATERPVGTGTGRWREGRGAQSSPDCMDRLVVVRSVLLGWDMLVLAAEEEEGGCASLLRWGFMKESKW